MKKRILLYSILPAILVSIIAFTGRQTAITGRINPAEGAQTIWAVNGKDSVKTNPVMGTFTLEVKPGNYSVIVIAKPPYKDVQVDNVQVTAEQTVDIGEIILQQ